MVDSSSWSARAQGQATLTACNNWNGRAPFRCNGTRQKTRPEIYFFESTIGQLIRRHCPDTGNIDSSNDHKLHRSISTVATSASTARNTATNTPTPAKSLLLLGSLASLSVGVVGGGDLGTMFLKPTVSSKACAGSAEKIAAKTETLGNDGACMQCDPAINVCPPGCQALMDALYVNCDGVTTPDGLYYDPSNVIAGEWSDNVKAAVKIATERCGCDRSSRMSQPRTVVGPIAFTTLLSLATLCFAAIVF